MGRPENSSRGTTQVAFYKAALRQANQPACPDNGGKPVRGWQGRKPLSLRLLESDSTRRALPGLHPPRLAAKVRRGHTLSHCIYTL